MKGPKIGQPQVPSGTVTRSHEERRTAESWGGGGQQRPKVMVVSLVWILKATAVISFWSDVHFKKMALQLESHTLAVGIF